MNKQKKVWIGILAFLPIILGIVILVYVFTNFIPNIIRLEELGEDPNPVLIFSQMAPFLILVILAALLHVGLLIFFIIHAINNKEVKSEERIIWVLVFIFTSSIGFPIYWGIRIWPDPKPESNFVKI